MQPARKRGRPLGKGIPDPPRPPKPPDGRVKFTTRLRPETIAFLREIGNGLANDGIERLEQAFRETLARHVAANNRAKRSDGAQRPRG
jgi:hypothetical protein